MRTYATITGSNLTSQRTEDTDMPILGLANLVLGANLGHGLALQALNDNHRFGLGVPFASVHG